MLSVLIVAPPETPTASAGPGIEILRAHDAEDAVEKLARNRRIDAILILSGVSATGIVAAIREENPAPPPLFVACGAGPVPAGSRPLPEDPAMALEALLRELE